MKHTIKRILHSLKRILLALLAIPISLFLLSLPVWIYGYVQSLDVDERIPPPGRMVDIGTHKLHISCSGEGLPTVILEAGGADWSASWAGVKSLLPNDIRVCSYDRAGLGWSERGPNPRNAQTIVSELERLLANSGERAPYLFVGHSFGGTVGLSYLESNLENAAGFVAVEAPTYSFMKYRHETRFILQGTGRVIASPFFSVILSATKTVFPMDINTTSNNYYSSKEIAALRDAGFQTRMAPMITREEPFVENLEPKTDFGSLPIVVIQGVASHLSSAQWNANQQELLSMSSDSKLIYASADHGVPRQAPESVVDGIEWVRSRMNN